MFDFEIDIYELAKHDRHIARNLAKVEESLKEPRYYEMSLDELAQAYDYLVVKLTEHQEELDFLDVPRVRVAMLVSDSYVMATAKNSYEDAMINRIMKRERLETRIKRIKEHISELNLLMGVC